MPTLQRPRPISAGAGDLFDESGAVKKPEIKPFVDEFLAAFVAWIERKAKAPA
jgi:chromate reductase